MNVDVNTIYQGSCLDVMKTWDDQQIDMCVTSPPYWGLRNYHTDGQLWGGKKDCLHEWDEGIKKGIGPLFSNKCGLMQDGRSEETRQKTLNDSKMTTQMNDAPYKICSKCGAWIGELGQEPTPELYIQHLLLIFQEVKRVLKDTGTCWVNLGDTYYGGKGASSCVYDEERDMNRNTLQKSYHSTGEYGYTRPSDNRNLNLKPKTLVCIPDRFKIAMVMDGWICRNDIIWYKRNCMPCSVADRFTIDYERLFFFSKNPKYYFEQQFEIADSQPWSMNSLKGDTQSKNNPRSHGKQKAFFDYKGVGQKEYKENGVQNPSDVKRRILQGQLKKLSPIGGNKRAGGDNPTYSGKSWIPKPLDYNSKYKTSESGQSIQGFGRNKSIESEREQSRIKAQELFPDDPQEQQRYINFIHDHGFSGEVIFNDKQADELGCSATSGLRVKNKPQYMIRRNKRCVWDVPTEPHPEAHFATFPKELIRTPIKAGCPSQGIVLDPFFGSGTTGQVCQEEHKHYIGIELNPKYIQIAKKKLHLDYKSLTSFV